MPSFVLGLQPNHLRLKGHFLRNVITRALPGGVTDAIVVIAASLLAGVFALGTEQISTVTLFLLTLVGFMVLFKVCVPFDVIRICLFVLMIAAFVLTCIIMPGLFEIAPMTLGMLKEFLILGAGAIVIFVVFIKTKLFR